MQVRDLANKFVMGQEIGAQEAVFLALQLEFKHASRKCVYVNTNLPEQRERILKPNYMLAQLPHDSIAVHMKSPEEHYSERPPHLQRVTRALFATWYQKSRSGWRPLRKAAHRYERTDAPPSDSSARSESNDEGADSERARRRWLPRGPAARGRAQHAVSGAADV